MKLTLQRFEYELRNGSAGYWLIKQLPGVAVERQADGWVAYGANDYLKEYGEAPTKAWGENWQFDYSLLSKLDGILGKPHPTRGELLIKIEAALSQRPDNIGHAL